MATPSVANQADNSALFFPSSPPAEVPSESSGLHALFTLTRDDPARLMKYEIPLAIYRGALPEGHALHEHLRCDSLQDSRRVYQGFLPYLIEAARRELSKPIDQRDRAVIVLCQRRYFDVHMHPYLEGLVRQMVSAYEAIVSSTAPGSLYDFSSITTATFVEHLQIVNRLVGSSPNTKHPIPRQSERFHGAVLGKNMTEQNIPYCRCVYDFGEQAVVYARHPAPTLPGTWSDLIGGMASRVMRLPRGNGETIAPDYELAITDRKTLVCMHLHADKNVVQHEGGMVEAVNALSEKHDNFEAFVQPMDGTFFKSKPEGNFAHAKELILANFNTGGEMCSLPSYLRDNPAYETRMRVLLDDTHRLFFASREEIADDVEWQIFQLYFYIMQGTDRMIETNVDTFSSFCREFADRGGIRAFVQDLVYAKMIGELEDENILQQAMYNLFGATILIKRESVLPWRLPLAISATELLIALPKESFEGYEFPSGRGPKRVLVERPEGQEIPKEYPGSPSEHGPANVDLMA
jgi:hypothetical protein